MEASSKKGFVKNPFNMIRYIRIKRLLLSVLMLFASVAVFAADKQKTTYEYDKLNRLVKVVSPLGETTYTYDALGNRLTRTFKANKSSIVPGDADNNNVVNAADIIEAAKSIMNQQSDHFNKKGADPNEDNVVNIADIIKIVNIILSGH